MRAAASRPTPFKCESQVKTMSSETIAGVVPILPVQDLTRAIEFYEHLGFTAKRYRDGDFYAFIQRDGRELHLSKTPKLVPEHNSVRVYFIYARVPRPRSKHSVAQRG